MLYLGVSVSLGATDCREAQAKLRNINLVFISYFLNADSRFII